MYSYLCYGLIWKSEIEIDYLVRYEEDDKFDVLILMASEDDEVLNYARDGSDVSGEYKNGLWFKNKQGVFAIYGGKEVLIKSQSEMKDILPFITGYCMAIILTQRNLIVLHGSAINVKGNGIVIGGISGAGKSSLGAFLVEKGEKLLSDDLAVIEMSESAKLLPGFGRQNICNDMMDYFGYDTKTNLIMDEEREKYFYDRKLDFYTMDSNLNSIYILIENENYSKVRVIEVLGSDKVKVILENLFLGHLISHIPIKPSLMKAIVELVSKTKIFFIMRPKNKITLKQQYRKIRKNL